MSADDYMDEDHPPYGCDTEPTGPCGDSSSAGPANGGSCEGSSECESGQVCAASFDGDIGQFECTASCIEPMDDSRWCFDSSACCDASSVCTRGYCIPGDGASTTDVADSSSGGGSGSSSTDTTTSSDSGSTSTTDATTGGSSGA